MSSRLCTNVMCRCTFTVRANWTWAGLGTQKWTFSCLCGQRYTKPWRPVQHTNTSPIQHMLTVSLMACILTERSHIHNVTNWRNSEHYVRLCRDCAAEVLCSVWMGDVAKVWQQQQTKFITHQRNAQPIHPHTHTHRSQSCAVATHLTDWSRFLWSV